MAEIDIQELIWNSINEPHIWDRHQLTRAEVEEVAYGPAEHLKVRRTYEGRYFVTGPKADQRLLVLILASKGAGKYYPVSARPADKKERREYQEWKASKHL